MINGLLDNGSINLNTSGYNDDSIYTETDYYQERDNNNFLPINSNNNNDLQIETKEAILNQKNSLQNDFDGIFSNQNINNYNDVMFEDLFSNAFAIPMNRPSKFSISPMGHQFIYESNSKIKNYKIDSIKFGLSKSAEVITYLLSLFTFSEFFNLEEIEKDKRFKVFFIKQNKAPKKFIVDDKNLILNNLGISEDKANDFEMFINDINNFLSENEYLELQKKNKRKLIFANLFIAIISLLIIGVIITMYFTIKIIRLKGKDTDNHIIGKILLVLEGLLLLIFVFGLIIKIIDAKNMKLNFLYYDLRYFLINYNRIYERIENWNKTFFENYKIRASMPISLNYIMFNLNPYQDIEIKHLDMNLMKNRFYKSQKDLFKTQKDLKLFHLIQQNMLLNTQRYSTSIN